MGLHYALYCLHTPSLYCIRSYTGIVCGTLGNPEIPHVLRSAEATRRNNSA